MNIDEYKIKVIEHFKSGNATDIQWAEMADAVLNTYESNNYEKVFTIDREICHEDYDSHRNFKPLESHFIPFPPGRVGGTQEG